MVLERKEGEVSEARMSLMMFIGTLVEGLV